ncbi:uncharacterized protein [Fopius arisanus]|uniref:Uncharacterized protein n=1 Tax=Fopius arisanus TaxID=64838 RepID=A0A9R1U783_9HYME|nr:PREDICTED: uncharacterized protein LOC105270527 [Fopius arisanus]
MHYISRRMNVVNATVVTSKQFRATMKNAVIVCAILLISGTQASFIGDSVTAIQEKIESGIDAAIKQVQEIVQSAQKKAQQIGEDLKVEAEAIAQRTYELIRQRLSEIDERIVNITSVAGVDVDECIKIGETLETPVLASISNMSSCVVEKLQLGSGYVESMVAVSNNVIETLNNLREEARNCSNEVDGVKGATKAILCANVAAAKATWATAKGVPSVTASVAKLSYLLGTLHITLPYCTAQRGFISLVRESDRVIAEVRSCVDRKIIESKPSPSSSASPLPELPPQL